MADLFVIPELQTYLVAEDIGQLPSAAPSLTVPAIWKAPRDGAPLPRNIGKDSSGRWQGETTITLRKGIGRDPSPMEPWIEEQFVDIIVRSPQPETAESVQRAIKLLLVPWDAVSGHYNWQMGGILVECCKQWRGDQPLPQRQAIGESDAHQTYDRIASYVFRVRRKVLAGLSMP